MAPGVGAASGLSRRSRGVRAAARAALTPPAKPRLRSSAMTVACGAMVRARAALPSVEALSATMISASPGSMAVRQRSSHAADCQLTTRTETDGPGTRRTISVAVGLSRPTARHARLTRRHDRTAAGVQCHEGSIDADQDPSGAAVVGDHAGVGLRQPPHVHARGDRRRCRRGAGGARHAARPGRLGAGRQRVADRQRRQEPAQHQREGQRLRGHHQLQQLLRVRHRQERPGALRRQADGAAVDGEDRRPRRQAGRLPDRGPAQASRSRSGSIACAASRRGRW